MEAGKILDILHDHYKESFKSIRNRERERDRLFLFLIGLLGLLVLEFNYAVVGASFKVTCGIAQVDATHIPSYVILSTTWTFLFFLLLKYCQITTTIDKQYPYLHSLEADISKLLGNPELYQREGKAYFASRDELFRHWIWIFYTVFFPAVVVLAAGSIGISELRSRILPPVHQLYDLVLSAMTVFVILLYRGIEVATEIGKQWENLKRNSQK